jgi:LemA protein
MKKFALFGCGGLVLVLIAVVVVAAIFVAGAYNGFVKQEEGVKTAWSQVENVYQRRADLIPNLVETVKGVANFEKETYTAVTEARSRVGQIKVTPEMLNDPNAFAQFQKAQGELGSAISRLLVVAENYPQLKANQNFLELQSQLEGTENRIAVERRSYNEVAQRYNTAVRTFPRNFVASLFGFKQKAYFEAAPGADKAPQVKF